MKDPTRLLDMAASESELRLLRAGASEEPHPEAMQRLAAKLGASHAALQPSALHSTGANVSASLSTKLVVAAAVLGIGGLGGLWYTSRSASHAPTSHAPPIVQPSAAPDKAIAPLAAPITIPEPAFRQESAALADEIARLDAVRKLLADSRAKPALTGLRNYEREYPQGALRQEAALLRIEALSRTGDRVHARTLAGRFLAENPDSPHAPRVRALALESTGAHAR